MKEKSNKSIATLCILLFHLGLLYMVYQQIVPEKQTTPDTTEMQTNRP